MARDDAHHLKDCADLYTCPRHAANVLVQDEGQARLFLEIAKRNSVPGQIPGGCTVEKQTWEQGDMHTIGAQGKVIGCVEVDGMRGYFIEWDDFPGQPVFLQSYKIRRAADPGGPHVS